MQVLCRELYHLVQVDIQAGGRSGTGKLGQPTGPQISLTELGLNLQGNSHIGE
jgi:hypothetical protein